MRTCAVILHVVEDWGNHNALVYNIWSKTDSQNSGRAIFLRFRLNDFYFFVCAM